MLVLCGPYPDDFLLIGSHPFGKSGHRLSIVDDVLIHQSVVIPTCEDHPPPIAARSDAGLRMQVRQRPHGIFVFDLDDITGHRSFHVQRLLQHSDIRGIENYVNHKPFNININKSEPCSSGHIH